MLLDLTLGCLALKFLKQVQAHGPNFEFEAANSRYRRSPQPVADPERWHESFNNFGLFEAEENLPNPEQSQSPAHTSKKLKSTPVDQITKKSSSENPSNLSTLSTNKTRPTFKVGPAGRQQTYVLCNSQEQGKFREAYPTFDYVNELLETNPLEQIVWICHVDQQIKRPMTLENYQYYSQLDEEYPEYEDIEYVEDYSNFYSVNAEFINTPTNLEDASSGVLKHKTSEQRISDLEKLQRESEIVTSKIDLSHACKLELIGYWYKHPNRHPTLYRLHQELPQDGQLTELRMCKYMIGGLSEPPTVVENINQYDLESKTNEICHCEEYREWITTPSVWQEYVKLMKEKRAEKRKHGQDKTTATNPSDDDDYTVGRCDLFLEFYEGFAKTFGVRSCRLIYRLIT